MEEDLAILNKVRAEWPDEDRLKFGRALIRMWDARLKRSTWSECVTMYEVGDYAAALKTVNDLRTANEPAHNLE
jgi:hypothetical protein